MTKIYLIMFALMTISFQAQEIKNVATTTKENLKTYKVSKNKGKLVIYLGKVTVEGYKGNEIIISLEGQTSAEDKRADGLQSINALGLTDNTGLGINVTEKDGILEVKPLKKISSSSIKILVPENIIISLKHQSQYGGRVIFRNMENEIEIASTYNDILLENVTGPATVKSIHGNVDAVFNQNIKGPLSIISVYGHTDVSIPKSVKANLKAKTSYGEIYVSPDFKIDIEKKDDMLPYDSELVGKVNGGGIAIEVRSDYSKIYLRAK